MEIEITKKGSELLVKAQGYLDTAASSEFETSILKEIDSVDTVIIDCSGIGYISSKGLRALVYIQKTLGSKGRVIIRNPNDVVRETLYYVGFKKVITIE